MLHSVVHFFFGGMEMKQLEINKGMLAHCHNFLFKLVVPTSKINRKKYNLMDLLEKKVKEVNQEEKLIWEELAEKNEEGKPEIDINSNYVLSPENKIKATQELTELYEEKVIMNYGEYVKNIDEIMAYLDDYEGEISGHDGNALNVLLMAYENGKDDK